MSTGTRLLILSILSISATLGIVLGALFATGTFSSKAENEKSQQGEDYPLAYQNFYDFDSNLAIGNVTLSSSNDTTDVIIIGLGLAGLAAAQTLGHSNLRVHVLEAMVRSSYEEL
jgi:NADPH-dependent 2,4-dienoyl-CoA reductase/sulfur reductase-like enzyme